MSVRETASDPDVVVTEKMATRIVSLLLLLAALSVYVLWTVNPVGSGEESTFALFIAVDLIAVGMISYVQRSVTERGRIGRVPMIAGCCLILLLVFAAFYLLHSPPA
jgi:hypothetical protein